MPENNPPLSSDNIALIESWINEGASEAASGDTGTEDNTLLHYMKLEGFFNGVNQEGTAAFNVHLGPTMDNDYSFVVTGNVDITISSFGTTGSGVTIKMDINEWFTDPNDYNFSEVPATIMTSTNAQATLQGNGHSVITIEE